VLGLSAGYRTFLSTNSPANPSAGTGPVRRQPGDTQAAGEGEAPGRKTPGHAIKRDLGDVLRPRSARDFPNAAYVVSSAEWDFSMDPDLKSKMPAEMGGFVDGAQKYLGAV